MAASETPDLLAALDRADDDALIQVEDAIVAQGENAVELLLASVAAINQRQKRSIDSLADIPALERRIRLLGRIKSPRAIRTVLDAVADSAIAVESYTRQRNAATSPFNPHAATDSLSSMMVFDQHIYLAKSLNRAAVTALANYGQSALPQIEHYFDQVSPPVQRSLERARRLIQPPWWRLFPMRKFVLALAWVVVAFHLYGLFGGPDNFYGRLLRFESTAFAFELLLTYTLDLAVTSLIGLVCRSRLLLFTSLISIIVTTLRLVVG